jgi:hypothetical protein
MGAKEGIEIQKSILQRAQIDISALEALVSHCVERKAARNGCPASAQALRALLLKGLCCGSQQASPQGKGNEDTLSQLLDVEQRLKLLSSAIKGSMHLQASGCVASALAEGEANEAE